MCKSFVQFLSIQYHFSVDRQLLDTSGHVLGEVDLCDRLSVQDLVTTPILQVSFLTGLSVSSQMS